MNRNLLILFFLSFCTMLAAQSESKAAALFEAGQYAEAGQMYEKLLHKSPKNVLYSYRYARCAQETGDHTTAIQHFAKTGKKYVLTYFFLGESYMALWQPEQAIEAYQKYLELSNTSDRTDHVEKQIAIAEMRQRYMKRVREIHVYDSVSLPKNRFLEAYNLSPETGSLAQDTNLCVTYRNQRADRSIYAVTTGNGSKLVSRYRLLDQWSAPDTLSDIINFTSTQNYPFCQSDGITIYFAAEAEDGFGGLDIYMSRYNSANNTYTKPENIGLPFNSSANDYMFVTDEINHIAYFATDRFCHPDSVSIYSFLLTDEPAYVSNTTPDSLALFAQLKTFLRADKEDIMTTTHSVAEYTQPENNRNNIHFVLNDTTVYLTDTDFVSREAQQLFATYQQQLAEFESIDRQLNSLREDYRNADTDSRKALVTTITKLEKDYKRLQQQSAQTLLQVRRLELSALNTAAPLSSSPNA